MNVRLWSGFAGAGLTIVAAVAVTVLLMLSTAGCGSPGATTVNEEPEVPNACQELQRDVETAKAEIVLSRARLASSDAAYGVAEGEYGRKYEQAVTSQRSYEAEYQVAALDCQSKTAVHDACKARADADYDACQQRNRQIRTGPLVRNSEPRLPPVEIRETCWRTYCGTVSCSISSINWTQWPSNSGVKKAIEAVNDARADLQLATDRLARLSADLEACRSDVSLPSGPD